MSGAVFETLRAAVLSIAKSSGPLLQFRVIESGASTGSLDANMEELVSRCDAVLMILHKPPADEPPMRQGVAKEYLLARAHKKALLLLVENGYEDDQARKAFLEQLRQDRDIKTCPYTGPGDLFRVIEVSIYSDMLAAYALKLRDDGKRVAAEQPTLLNDIISRGNTAGPVSPSAVVKGGGSRD